LLINSLSNDNYYNLITNYNYTTYCGLLTDLNTYLQTIYTIIALIRLSLLVIPYKRSFKHDFSSKEKNFSQLAMNNHSLIEKS